MEIIERIKRTSRQQQHQEPPKYVLMLHVNPAAPKMTVYIVAHVLHDHLNVPENAAIALMHKALSEGGKTPIMPVTKDVGESLLHEINSCPIHRDLQADFKISLELQ